MTTTNANFERLRKAYHYVKNNVPPELLNLEFWYHPNGTVADPCGWLAESNDTDLCGQWFCYKDKVDGKVRRRLAYPNQGGGDTEFGDGFQFAREVFNLEYDEARSLVTSFGGSMLDSTWAQNNRSAYGTVEHTPTVGKIHHETWLERVQQFFKRHNQSLDGNAASSASNLSDADFINSLRIS